MTQLSGFHGIRVVENQDVPANEIWIVSPPKGPLDKRTNAERTTRVVNIQLPEANS
jgi:hypothetical protein